MDILKRRKAPSNMLPSETIGPADPDGMPAPRSGEGLEVVLVGYPFAPAGMGEGLRACGRALRAAGGCARVYDLAGEKPGGDVTLQREFRPLPSGAQLSSVLNIFHVNAEEVG